MMGIKEWKRRYYYIFEKNLAYVDTPFPVSGVRCYFCWCCRRCRAKARTYGKVETNASDDAVTVLLSNAT